MKLIKIYVIVIGIGFGFTTLSNLVTAQFGSFSLHKQKIVAQVISIKSTTTSTPEPTPETAVATPASVAPVAAYSPPTTVVTSGVVQNYIAQVFGSATPLADCIAQHESGFRADATNHNYNGTWDVGVFQINDVHGLSWDYRMNYINNINYAYQLSDGGRNWGAWTTAKYCI